MLGMDGRLFHMENETGAGKAKEAVACRPEGREGGMSADALMAEQQNLEFDLEWEGEPVTFIRTLTVLVWICCSFLMCLPGISFYSQLLWR